MSGWTTGSMDMSLSKRWEIVKDGKPGMLQSMGSQRVGHDLVTEQKQQQKLIRLVNTIHFALIYTKYFTPIM